ncbi:MAG TPA: chromosome partition protein MukB [Polyangiaceae bacterium]|nr:chromosome partition protein MukB [Polyangiaceae bacterium]
MTRTRAAALALVNWKGVFYERYLLDRHVTALEGANGAGKTTVMIAAYVVLLPDLSRLRFTNLGESAGSSSDKGIWGRLGEAERPSYAALDLVLANGERLIMGVHLERKSEPALEVTPFIVTEIGADYRLQDLLLSSDGEFDQVPVLKELRANAKSSGARLEVFASTKDYFSALFERGVTALRLGSDEDRNKLNEMLRTSMTGGISRALTTELRSFLLKEETGLSDTLSRMRENLDACRRTRIEVSEARRLEHEIHGVYEAGQSMFRAALHATRLAHEESCARVATLREEYERALGEAREIEANAAGLLARNEAIGARTGSLEAAVREARAHIEQLERAQLTAARIAQLEAELGRADLQSQAASGLQKAAIERRRGCRTRLEQTRGDYDRAARGVADLQAGLEEMHRRAHTRRSAHAKLAQLRALLEKPALGAAELPSLREHAAARLAELDRERARLDREAKAAEAVRADHQRAKAALAELGADTTLPNLYELGRQELSRLTEQQARLEHATELAAELERAERLAPRQAFVRERALAAGIDLDTLPVAPVVERRLRELEGAARETEDGARAAQSSADSQARAATLAAARLRELELVTARWQSFHSKLQKLERAYGSACDSEGALEALRERLRREREQLRVASASRVEQRDALLRELSSLEIGTRALHPDLLRLSDELDAELLVERFEDIDPADAARVEAELGPFVQALVVSDPEAAARAVAGRARELPSVWLVERTWDRGSAPVEVETLGDGGDVIVSEPQGVRVTRLSKQPALGRAARQRRIEELTRDTKHRELELERLAAQSGQIDGALLEVERTWSDRSLFEQTDPSADREAVQTELEHSVLAEREQRERALALTGESQGARAHAETLRSLLAEAYLLDAPDYAARHAELVQRQKQLEAARVTLAQVETPRRILSQLLESLRNAVPGAGAEQALELAQTPLELERDRWFSAQQQLSELTTLEHALFEADVETTASEQTALLPSLDDQLAELGRAVEAADAALAEAETEWEQKTLSFQEAEAARIAILAQRDRSAQELAALAVQDPSEAAQQRAVQALAEAERELHAIAREQRSAESGVAVEKERAVHKRSTLSEIERRLRAEEERALPARVEWEGLCEAARRERVLQTAFAEPRAAHGEPSSVEARAEGQSRLDVLCDRLRAARADDVVHAIHDSKDASGDKYLAAWLRARDWLKRRLPAQVAEEAEPLEALDRLRSHLANLEQRLTRQESDLRGTSEDVARSIDVQVRRARTQVRRLNQHLTEVSFGSIRGIRVQMGRIERMDQVLNAFREGTAQELLFNAALPIEEALDEIFRRYGGGKSGGQRLLDYREYIELRVEVQRQASSEWELANPSRLSTGEAIGVGAALMMVVLTEWERDAKFLRPKAVGGSLRFLFLDEANRLSQDNLGVLFELCQNLELQLLIAAPEVARATGNTTYRLVRVLGDDGREAVLVSGRRTLPPDTSSVDEPVPPPEAAVPEERGEAQGQLFNV